MKLVVIRLLGPPGLPAQQPCSARGRCGAQRCLCINPRDTQVYSMSCMCTDSWFLQHPICVRAAWNCFSR